jgi:V/A-type H+-transporting ATPase subunit K
MRRQKEMDLGTGMALVGAGIAIGAAGIGTGIAQSQIGAAAVGATAEDPKMFGRGIILLVLPETIVILGFVIAILLWLKS